MAAAHHTFNVKAGHAYSFVFENYKSEVERRVVIARAVSWGATPWHPELQWFLEAYDVSRQEVRNFPLAGIQLNTFALYTDEQLDVFLTQKAREEVDDAVEKALTDESAGFAAALDRLVIDRQLPPPPAELGAKWRDVYERLDAEKG